VVGVGGGVVGEEVHSVVVVVGLLVVEDLGKHLELVLHLLQLDLEALGFSLRLETLFVMRFNVDPLNLISRVVILLSPMELFTAYNSMNS